MITLDWKKVDGLIPAIIQDYETLEILMLGYMNKEALEIPNRQALLPSIAEPKKRYGLKVRPLEINYLSRIFVMIVIRMLC